MPANQTNSEFRQLLIGLVDGQLDALGLRRFEEILTASPELQRFYDEFMTLHGMLLWRAGPPLSPVGRDDIGQIAELRFQAGDAPASPPGFIGAAWQGATGFFAGNEFALPYTVAVLLIGVAMLFGSMVHISRDMRFVENDPARTGPGLPHEGETLFVGQITDMKDCRWADPDTSTIVGAHVALKRKYSLSSGLLEITYRSGARVILEGPCEYTADSAAGGYLGRGKLTARVEKKVASGQRLVAGKKWRVESGEWRGSGGATGNQPRETAGEDVAPKSLATSHQPLATGSSSLAPHPSSLFTVTTPTAVVTDLGTEFGVEVSENGDTTSHVFRGAVRVEAAGEDSVVLRRDESVRVEKDGRVRETHHATGEKIEPVRFTYPTAPPKFVRRIREIPKSLDLLDIVAGGDGTGRRRDYGIDPSTGLQDPQFLPGERVSDGKYHRTPNNKLIDGVFIPNPNLGPVQLDSVGHAFKGFPRQNDGGTFGAIWSRAARVQPRENWSPNPDFHYWIYTANFDDGFMPEKRGLLGMHANAGITFDLAAIRSARSSYRSLTCFRAMAGKARSSLAEMLVFVDGRLAWKSGVISNQSGINRVEVPIHSTDRFLTLVTIEASDGRGSDWTVFGDPVLECLDSDQENK